MVVGEDVKTIVLNKGHMHRNVRPKLDDPNLDIMKFIPKFEAYVVHFNESDKNALRSALLRNDRYRQIYEGTKDEVTCVKQLFTEYITSIKNHTIAHGEPANYESVEFMLQFIFQEQEKLERKDRAKYAMRIKDELKNLAIQGGEHCGVGKIGVTEKTYQSYLPHFSGFKIDNQVLSFLRNFRIRIFESIYYWFYKATPLHQGLGKMIGESDLHAFNQFERLYGEMCGVETETAKNDAAAFVSPFQRFVGSLAGRRLKDIFFDEGIPKTPKLHYFQGYKFVSKETQITRYTPQYIVQEIKEALQSRELDQKSYYQWWHPWIEREWNKKGEQEGKGRDEIDGEIAKEIGKLYDRDDYEQSQLADCVFVQYLDDSDDYEFDERSIIAFLLEQGIFTVA